jgi:hypothetical protein
MRRLSLGLGLVVMALGSACGGSAAAPGVDGGAGSGADASAGTSGGAGTGASAGTSGAAGTSGGAGTGASAGTSGAAGTSGGAGTSANADGAAGASDGGDAGTALFATDFDVAESPLSEGGKWKHDGLDWTRVATAAGVAYGTQDGKSGFDDSYAYLAGTFAADQSASAVIHLAPGVAASYAEVEILLRWHDQPHLATGYECNLAWNGQYAEIVRWPGPLGKTLADYQFLSRGNQVAAGVHDGDVLSCEIVGGVITSRLNGKVIATATDPAPIATGAPGIGYFSDGTPAGSKYGFTSFRTPAR